jgi:hypothetical protein
MLSDKVRMHEATLGARINHCHRRDGPVLPAEFNIDVKMIMKGTEIIDIAY